MLYFLLVVLWVSNIRISTFQNILTIIGDKNLTHRNGKIPYSFSKLFIHGPFYCQITWIYNNNEQTIDIYTDDNIHPYVIVTLEKDTLKIIIESNVNLKYTQMNMYLNLRANIEEIVLTGITTCYSLNELKTNNLFKLRTEDTTSLYLILNVTKLDALFLSAGHSQLIGHVKDTAFIKYNGIGDVDALELICKNIYVNANGLGTVSITGIEKCVIQAEGVSIVKYNCYHNISYSHITDLAKIIPGYS